MRVLLDTHVLLQLSADPEVVPSSIRHAVDAAERRVLSVASVWEIAIKTSIGKLRLPLPAVDYVKEQMARMLLVWLPIAPEHLALVSDLPWHHRDPFDRMLIAQARADQLTILTLDRAFRAYDVALVN